MNTKNIVETYTGAGLTVTAGRTTVLDVGAPALRVLDWPAEGNASINPDGTVALVLPNAATRGALSFTVEVQGKSGPEPLTIAVTAEDGTHGSDWGKGDHYLLETDADGRVVVEPGENHRKVYVSAAADALGLAEIAQREGVPQSRIDGAWLADRPQYGATEGMALDSAAGDMLWKHLTRGADPVNAPPSSHWLLLERGHDYTELGRLVERGSVGESALHPIYVGAWGDGPRPVIQSEMRFYQDKSENIVVQDLEFREGIQALEGDNILLDGLVIRDGNFIVQGLTRFTLRDSQIVDVARDESLTEGEWGGAENKFSGGFIRNTEGLLLEGNLFDHNGWEADYRYDRSLEGGQPPSKFSHNLYVQYDNTDVTFRDSASLRGASYGAQIRSGGVVEDSLFADNNVAFQLGYKSTETNNFSLAHDNLVSIAGYKQVDSQEGALAFGILNKSPKSTLLGNIITHLTDPSDAAGKAERDEIQPDTPLKNGFPPYADDTIIYNWLTERNRPEQDEIDRNVPDIATSKLDAVTLKNFVEDELGRKGGADGIAALANWLRANWDGLDGPADVLKYFHKGFGTWEAPRTTAETLRFVPDSRGDGMRWDNRLNWSTEDLPGTVDGDAVDLGGNWVTFGGTVRVAGLDLGTAGLLTVRQGRLEVGNLETGPGGAMEIGNAGQFWTQGYDGAEALEIEVSGGRFANTGIFEGPADVKVSGGEALLAAGGDRFDLTGRLDVNGSTARVGFDGQGGGEAVLRLREGSTLGFRPAADGASAITEFRSGNWDTRKPDIQSVIDLGAGDTTLALNLGRLPMNGKVSYTLGEADQITGGFGAVDIKSVPASQITVTLDYGADLLSFEADGNAGTNGKASLELIGSGQSDVFHAARGAETVVLDYAGSDSIDVSALAENGGTISAVAQGSTTTELVLGSGGKTVTLATVKHAAGLDAFTVLSADGTLKLGRNGTGDLNAAPVPVDADSGSAEPDPAPGGGGNGNAAPEVVGAFGSETFGVNTWTRLPFADYFGDPDGDALDFVLEGAPGFVFDNGRGDLVVGPKQGDAGTYAFGITASDGTSTSGRLEAELTILPKGAEVGAPQGSAGNAAPEVVGAFGSETFGVNTWTRLPFADYFGDPDGDALDFVLEGAPGFVFDNGRGDLVVGPKQGDAGTYAFGITASDGTSTSGRLEAELTILPKGAEVGAPQGSAGNAAPEVVGAFGSETFGVNTWTRLPFADYFGDPDGDALDFVLEGAPGFVFDNGRGDLVVGPKQGDAGTYAFGITASDGTSTSGRLEAELTILPKGAEVGAPQGSAGNAAPEVVGAFGSETFGVNTWTRLPFADYFGDPDGDALSFVLEGAPGFVFDNGRGDLVVGPKQGDVGTHDFTITASDGELTAALAVTIGVEDWTL